MSLLMMRGFALASLDMNSVKLSRSIGPPCGTFMTGAWAGSACWLVDAATMSIVEDDGFEDRDLLRAGASLGEMVDVRGVRATVVASGRDIIRPDTVDTDEESYQSGGDPHGTDRDPVPLRTVLSTCA